MMPAEVPIRKRRTPGGPPQPAPEGDHRKRRRNRTTQSCLNCHVSKRMCDRKRPACQRCTTLGLTGLCIYEVDDPSQRLLFRSYRAKPSVLTDPPDRERDHDDRTLLRNRVAELEGVIREMKKKPHPKWTQKLTTSLNSDEQVFQWSAHGRHPSSDTSSNSSLSTPVTPSRPDTGRSSNGFFTPSPESADYAVTNSDPFVQSSSSAIQLSVVSPTPVGTPSPEVDNAPRHLQPPAFLHSFRVSSPYSSDSNMPSPVSDVSPSGSFFGTPVTPTSPSFGFPTTLSPPPFIQTDLDNGSFDSLLNQIRDLQTEENIYENIDHEQTKTQRGQNISMCQCGCLSNEWVYPTIFDLADKLRQAVGVLERYPSHSASGCPLFAKISDLDCLTSHSLSQIIPPQMQHVMSSDVQYNQCQLPGGSFDTVLSQDSSGSLSISPEFLDSAERWDHLTIEQQYISNHASEDPLMTWDGTRHDWSIPTPNMQ